LTCIYKARREWFGGVVYSENPGFTAFVDARRADSLGIPRDTDLRDGLFSAPLDVHFSITNRCNLWCRGCYARNKKEPAGDMPLDLAMAIIDRLGDLNVFTIALGGGEPFLHPDLFVIAHYARSRNIVPNITTNGLIMDPTLAERCRVFGSVHVSCHHPSDLSHLAKPVRLLKQAGIDIGINVLLSAESHAELPRIWAWGAKHGISRILLLKFKLTEHNADCQDLVLPPADEQVLLPRLRQLARRHSIMPMLDCSLFPAFAFTRPKRSDLERFDVNGCVGGNAILAVTSDGYYKPCSFCAAPCGDARLLNRYQWKENQALAQFRRLRIHSACGGCKYKDLCNGGCRVSMTEWCHDDKTVHSGFYGGGQAAPSHPEGTGAAL